jgi:hypothetical protein
MTRDFKKQRRDNERPYSRNSSSSRYGEERSPRPARPRLNRDMVDRAWENGARRDHPDYHAHRSDQSQSPRDNRQRYQQPTAQNSRNYRKPYGNRQDGYRSGERNANSRNGARPRSYESGMRKFDEQRYDEHQGYSDRPGAAGPRPAYPRYSDSRSQGRGQSRDPRRRDFEREERPPRGPDRDYRKPREFDREARAPRSFERDKRSSRHGPQPDTQNPRWQSRPDKFSRRPQGRPQESSRFRPDSEQFEGDYERFDAANTAQSSSREHADTRERDVRGVSNERVWKGSRDVKRKNDKLRAEITREADELVAPVVKPPDVVATEEAAEHPADPPQTAPTREKPESRTRAAGAARRERKTGAGQSKPRARSTGPRPSQRGYKWPAP